MGLININPSIFMNIGNNVPKLPLIGREGASALSVTSFSGANEYANGIYIINGGFYRISDYSIYSDWCFKRFNYDNGSWETLSPFPANDANEYGRKGGSFIEYDGILYYGFGVDGWGTVHKDWYAYNPLTDSWTQKTDLPKETYRSFEFVYQNYIYIVSNKIYKYNTTSNTWSSITTCPISCSTSFKIDNIIYVLDFPSYLKWWGGDEQYHYDDIVMYEYNMGSSTWTAKNNFPNPVDSYNLSTAHGNDIIEVSGIYNVHSFSSGNYGYLGLGYLTYYEDGYPDSCHFHLNNIYKYDPNTDSWGNSENFIVKHNGLAVVFEYYNTIYIGTGKYETSPLPPWEPPIDFWFLITPYITNYENWEPIITTNDKILTFDWQGDPLTSPSCFNLEANCEWTAEASDSWINITTVSGIGNMSYYVNSCDINNTGYRRQGWVIFKYKGSEVHNRAYIEQWGEYDGA